MQQQVQRQRKAGTGFVDAHAERYGGADDSNAVLDPVVLNLRSVGSRNKLVSQDAHWHFQVLTKLSKIITVAGQF